MSSYLENLKWIISGQKEASSNQHNQPNQNNKNNIQVDNFDELHLLNGSDLDLDLDLGLGLGSELESDSDYDKIISKDITNSPKFTDKHNKTLKSIQADYDKIHMNLIEKEQLIRGRINSDTIEKIKENYTEYINDDVQIIKDFATIMETFKHIKDKLKDFETDIKDFEEDIRKKTMNQYETKLELDNKINHIDERLENTIELMNLIKSNGDDFIKKIIHLENLIQTHDEHRNQILTKLGNFDKEHNEMKNYNLKILNFLHDYQQNWIFTNPNQNFIFNYNYLTYVKIGMGLGLCSFILFGYRFIKKN